MWSRVVTILVHLRFKLVRPLRLLFRQRHLLHLHPEDAVMAKDGDRPSNPTMAV
jgi:hypothetical protein